MQHSSHLSQKLITTIILAAITASLFVIPVSAGGETPVPTTPEPETVPPPDGAEPPSSEAADTGWQPAAPAKLKPGYTVDPDTIKMFNATGGWGISGQMVLSTIDGGCTWEEVSPPQNLPTGTKVQAYGGFLDPDSAWIIYSVNGQIHAKASVWFTRDGGHHWMPGPPLDHTAYGDNMWAEFFVLDSNVLWMMVRGVYVGAGTHYNDQLFRSIDGGQSWTGIPSSTFDDYTGMVFMDAMTGIRTMQTVGAYAAAPPAYQVTTDSGNTWQTRELPFPTGTPDLFTRYPYCETYEPVIIPPTSIRMLVGCFNAYKPPTRYTGYYYASDNAGESWTAYPLPAKAHAESSQLVYFGEGDILLLGKNSYRSSDGGNNWKFVKTVNWTGQYSFVDPLNGFAIARLNAAIGLVQTTDGGAYWKLLRPHTVK